MPYDITKYEPEYGGKINSAGNVVNIADAFDTTTSSLKVETVPATNTSGLLTFQSGAVAIGNGTVQDVSGYATLSLDVVISATATVIYEASIDNINFFGLTSITPSAGTSAQNSSTSTIRGLRFSISGWKFFRARISAYTSGTVDVTGYASTTPSIQLLTSNASFASSDASGTSSALIGVGSHNLLFDGTAWLRQRSAKIYKWAEYLALPVNTTFTVWTPTSTKKIRIMGLSVSVSGTCALNVRVGTAGSGTRIATLRFAGAGNYSIDFDNGYLATNASTDVLEINNPSANPTSATVDVHVTAWGTEE